MREVKYMKASSVDEAMRYLHEKDGASRLIAGGTDVIVKMRNDKQVYADPITLIDVFGVEEMRHIQLDGDVIRIGAMVTHTEIEKSELLRQEVPFLVEACRDIGGPQIRNRGTIGGNIVNASPAGDSVPPLVALDAVLHLKSRNGQRDVPISEFFTGAYKTIIQDDEILTEITFNKLPKDTKTVFVKIGRRKALSISRMNVAVAMHLDDQGTVDDMRFAAGSVMPKPRRIGEVETLFVGKVANDEMIQKAGEVIGEVMVSESGVRKSTTYKKPVIRDVTRSAIQKALD